MLSWHLISILKMKNATQQVREPEYSQRLEEPTLPTYQAAARPLEAALGLAEA
jgi:hypothetical protein